MEILTTIKDDKPKFQFTKEELIDMHNLKDEFLIEKWIDKLKDISFPSYYFNLTIKEAEALYNFSDSFLKNKKINDNEIIKVIKSLEIKLQMFIEENNLNKKGFFIKFSFRSPKDGYPLNSGKLKERFDNEVNRLSTKWDYNYMNKILNIAEEDYMGNIYWISFIQAWKDMLRCETSQEALNIILTSKRAQSDLITEIEYFKMFEMTNNDKENKESFNLNLVLREWQDGINVDMEFRVFVKNNLINAITEYNHPFLVQELQDKDYCNKIKTIIHSFWLNKVKSNLEYLKDYVIDFALLENGELFFIELNPFKDSCGSGMFSWKEDHNILHGLNRDKDKTEVDNIVMKVRRDTEIPYGDYYEGCIEPEFEHIMMESYIKFGEFDKLG